MSSLAQPREAVRRRSVGRSVGRRLTGALSRRGPDVLIAVSVSAFALVLLSDLARDFNVDSWLELVAGRLVWDTGIPHRETLTVMASGRTWINQQWLSQLLAYALYRLGGLSLLGVVSVALVVAPVAAATWAARHLRAPLRSVLITLPACLTLVAPSREIRTQDLAIPLFVACVYLLTTDSRRPSRRVLWCLPLLALWANLHGSVTLGAGLVALRGLTLAWERRHLLRVSPRAWRRPLALILGAPLAILITPYGLAIVGYYHSTIADGTLRQFVTEWKPITSLPIPALALFLVAGLALWSFGRHPEKTTLWEKLAFLALIAAAISVVRNALFCGLFALIILPVSWNYGPSDADPVDRRAAGGQRPRVIVNGLLVLATAALLALATTASLLRSGTAIQDTAQQPGLLAAVQRATRSDPTLRVLSDDHYADWLLWRDPSLDGRLANDVRFELLSDAQLTALQSVFAVVGTDWKRGARGYRLLALWRPGEPDAVRAFLHEPGRRVLYDHDGDVVILRSAAQARLS
jgi:hypothetical protein